MHEFTTFVIVAQATGELPDALSAPLKSAPLGADGPAEKRVGSACFVEKRAEVWILIELDAL